MTVLRWAVICSVCFDQKFNLASTLRHSFCFDLLARSNGAFFLCFSLVPGSLALGVALISHTGAVSISRFIRAPRLIFNGLRIFCLSRHSRLSNRSCGFATFATLGDKALPSFDPQTFLLFEPAFHSCAALGRFSSPSAPALVVGFRHVYNGAFLPFANVDRIKSFLLRYISWSSGRPSAFGL